MIIPNRIFSSNEARLTGLKSVHATDVVLFSIDGKLAAGRVRLLVEIEAVAFAVISEWTLSALEPTLGSANFVPKDDLHIVFLSDILSAVIWTELSPSLIRVLVPAQFRQMLLPIA